jgi:hypothetical protein
MGLTTLVQFSAGFSPRYYNAHTASGTHPASLASYAMGTTGYFPGTEAACRVQVNNARFFRRRDLNISSLRLKQVFLMLCLTFLHATSTAYQKRFMDSLDLVGQFKDSGLLRKFIVLLSRQY